MAPAFVPPVSATSAAFDAIFGVFVAAMVVLMVVVITWAVRHDVAGWREWRARQEARGVQDPPPSGPRRPRR